MVSKVAKLFTTFENNVKVDAPFDDLYNELLAIEEQYNGEFTDDKVFGLAAKALADKYFNSLYGQEMAEKERLLGWLGLEDMPVAKEFFTGILLSLITELKEKNDYWYQDYFRRLKNLSTKYKNGTISLGKFLKSVSVLNQSFSKNIPAGIARDTIGTFNSKFQRSLFVSMGFNEYVWQTAQDERVRGNPTGLYPNADPSHFVMEGLICRWDNEMVYSPDGKVWQSRYGNMERAHPGEAWNCRCTATPFVINVLKNIDQRFGV